jgi:hypothetical protein
MDAPETVTEAVRLLEQRGFRADFRIEDGGFRCGTCGVVHTARVLVVTDVFRFEGPSDPADEAIVLGMHCPACGDRGIVVSAFGVDADDQMLELAELLRADPE